MSISGLSPALAEGIEAEVLFQLEAGAPEPIAEELGIAVARIGGGIAVSMRNDVTDFWSKALGFGFTEPVTADLINEVIGFYRANDDLLAVLQIAPSVLPDNWSEIVAGQGLRAGARVLKHAGRIEDLQFGSSDLRVGRITAEQAHEWATVMISTVGMDPEGLVELTAAGVTNPAGQGFAAWDGNRIVATGGLLIHGEIASLHADATSVEYRGRGAQSALLAARVRAAAAAGCRWVVAETLVGGSSRRNLNRLGMKALYLRQNWIWEGQPVDRG